MGKLTAGKMRCSIIAAIAILYASASPIDLVPDESLFALDDNLAEARQTIDQMTAEGASDKDCRKLVTETRKDIETNVNTCQKTINGLPKGESCPSKGQDGVKTAKEAQDKADKHFAYTTTEVTKASNAKVEFGSRTFSSLTKGNCDTFFTSTTYTTAKTTYTLAVKANTKAKGAAEQAAKAYKIAVEAAAKSKLECECKVKADHKKTFEALSASYAANQKAWEFACKVECVLDGKTNCKCSATPQCKEATLTADVNAAVCTAPAANVPVAGKGVGSTCSMHDKSANQGKLSGTSCGGGYHGCHLKNGGKLGNKGGCCAGGGFHRRCHCPKSGKVDCKAMCDKDSGCLGWVNANHGCQWATTSAAC